jgi:glutamine---fructose-6-phosphate transaminase (isomerizing)
MCGILAMVGSSPTSLILVEGIKRREYRGYDSAGIAVINGNGLETRRCAGKLVALENLLESKPVDGLTGIAHTRWATHGAPTEANAHPHLSEDGRIALVHNGIVENYQTIKAFLTREGFSFHSDTDTEVLANLIQFHYDGNL